MPRTTLFAWAFTICGDVTALWFGYQAALSYRAWRVARIWDPAEAHLDLVNVQAAGALAVGGLAAAAIGALLFRRASVRKGERPGAAASRPEPVE